MKRDVTCTFAEAMITSSLSFSLSSARSGPLGKVRLPKLFPPVLIRMGNKDATLSSTLRSGLAGGVAGCVVRIS